MFANALLHVTIALCTSETDAIFGKIGVGRHSLIAPRPRGEKRSLADLSSLQNLSILTSRALELRGGGDDNYDGADRGRNGYYDSGRRGSDYNDRRKESGYGYQDDRGSRYQDDGRSNDYYGSQQREDRGRSGDFYEYGYQQDDGRDPYYQEDRYSQRDYYDGRGSSRGYSKKSSATSGMQSMVKFGNKRVGLMLVVFGALSTFLGITMFFNKGLLRIGNLLFIAGVPMTIGPGRTAGYFFQPKKSRATACLVLGIFLVLSGRPIIGMVLEIFGFLNLFGNMFPMALAVLRNMPIVGTLFGSGRSRSRKPSNRQDDYYDGWRDQDDDAERYY